MAYLLKPKKPPLLNQNTACGTTFRLQTSRVVGSSLKSRTILPSSVRLELPPAATRPLGKPTSRASQGRNKEIPPPNDVDSQVHPRRRTAGAGPRCDFYWPSPFFRSRCPSSSLVVITSVTNELMSVQNRSDLSMRENIVSGVSSELTA